VVQTQDLSNLAHRQPPLRHRDALPKRSGGSHAQQVVPRRLAPVLRPLPPFQCPPTKWSVPHWNQWSVGSGTGDRFGMESVIGMQWNGWSKSTGIRSRAAGAGPGSIRSPGSGRRPGARGGARDPGVD